MDLFPEYRDVVTIKEDGREYSFQVPYQHRLKPTEECFYENEVKSQREILKLFDTPDFEKVPIQVNLTFSEFLGLYQNPHIIELTDRKKIDHMIILYWD